MLFVWKQLLIDLMTDTHFIRYWLFSAYWSL